MSLQEYSRKNPDRLRRHKTDGKEVAGLRNVVNRGLRDASLPGLSNDQKFGCCYNAALSLARMTLALEGYRVAFGTHHHQTSFEAAGEALDNNVLTDFFELCRKKRIMLEYDDAGIISEQESSEILTQAINFRSLVEAWIEANHPNFKL